MLTLGLALTDITEVQPGPSCQCVIKGQPPFQLSRPFALAVICPLVSLYSAQVKVWRFLKAIARYKGKYRIEVRHQMVYCSER